MNGRALPKGRSDGRLLAQFTFAGLAGVALVVLVFALLVAPRERDAALSAAEHELLVRSEVRQTALRAWLHGAGADARTLAGFPTSRSLVGARPFREPDPEFHGILANYAHLHAIGRVLLLDGLNEIRAASDGDVRMSVAERAFADVVRSTRRDSLELLEGPTGRPEVLSAACTPDAPGVMLTSYDPQAWLYPLLRPPGGDRDCFLLRVEGNDALYLSPAHRDAATPLATRAGPKAMALYAPGPRARAGVDERGVAMIACTSALPGSPWRLVLEVPRAQALAAAKRGLLIAFAGTLAVLTALLAIAYALALQQRRAAELAIHRGRAEFAAMLDYAPDAILVVAPSGRVRHATRHAEEFYGYPPGGLTGIAAFARLHVAGTPPDIAEVGERLARRGFDAFETEHWIAGGLRVPVELSVREADLNGERVWIAVVRDLRARRADEARIHQLNRLLRATSAIGAALAQAEDEPRLFSAVCDAAVALGDYPVAVLSRRHENGSIERSAMAVAPAVAAPAASLDPFPTQYHEGLTGRCLEHGRTIVSSDLATDERFARFRPLYATIGVRSAAAAPVLVDGHVRAALTLYAAEPDVFDAESLTLLERAATDVGAALAKFEDRRARQRLEERLRALFATGPVGYVLADAAGVITDANAEFLRLSGHTVEDLAAGELHWSPTTPAHTPETLETELVRPDGTRVPVLVGELLLGGDAAETVAVLLDLAPMRAAAESLRQTQAQLLQAQKMETVGRLAGGVAHDFNNLLTVIQGYAELMQASGPRDAEELVRIEQIQRAAERASALTRQLLAFSRQQMLEPRVLDLRTLVLDAEKMLRRLLGERIDVVVSAARSVAPVLADPGQIEQVLLNLMVNARDAMPHGGTIRIELEDVDADAGYVAAHPPMLPGEYVRLAVIDQGEGIAPDVLPRIFEPFFTTKAAGEGTGLGLATVYGIVKQSGGFVWVASRPGSGATFEILLPRSEGHASALAAPEPAPAGRGECLLLVEDEAMVRRLVRSILEQHGYQVLEAAGRDAALRLAAVPGTQIGLLVTDVVLRDSTGPELAGLLRQRQPGLPVLFMSGYAHDGTLVRAQMEAGDRFLAKPFASETLLRTVRDALERRVPN